MSDERVHVKSWSELCKRVIFDGLNNRDVAIEGLPDHLVAELQQLYDLARRAGGVTTNNNKGDTQ